MTRWIQNWNSFDCPASLTRALTSTTQFSRISFSTRDRFLSSEVYHLQEVVVTSLDANIEEERRDLATPCMHRKTTGLVFVTFPSHRDCAELAVEALSALSCAALSPFRLGTWPSRGGGASVGARRCAHFIGIKEMYTIEFTGVTGKLWNLSVH